MFALRAAYALLPASCLLTTWGCSAPRAPARMVFDKAAPQSLVLAPTHFVLPQANASPNAISPATIDTALATRLPSARAYFLRQDGLSSYFVQSTAPEADATPLVLIHGLGTAGMRDFYPIVEQLAQRRPLLLIDLPALARSELGEHSPTPPYLASRVAALIRARITGPFDVLGHSLGGNVALTLAAHPEFHPRRLVIVDAAGILHRDVFVEAQLEGSLSSLSSFNRTLALAASGLGRRVLEATNPFAPSDALLSSGADASGQQQARAALGVIQHAIGPYLPAIESPTLLLWGAEDSIAPLRSGLLLQDRLTSPARPVLSVLDGVGHVPMSDAPAKSAQLIIDFLDAPEAPTAPPFDQVLAQTTVTGAQHSARELRLHCQGETPAPLQGHYSTVMLRECDSVLISNATIEQLVLIDSQVHLVQSRINGGIQAVDTDLWITGGNLTGAVALYLEDSSADIAGTRIEGSHAAIASKDGARLLLSATYVHSPFFEGWLHEQLDLKKRQAL